MRQGNRSMSGFRVLMGVCLWLVGGTGVGLQQRCLSQESRPNFILMMGDDHGWEETGYNGHPHVLTPSLDEMAAKGLKFERFYAAHPNCSPTRASFLTGRHPNRMGTFAPGWSIRPEEITLAHLLQRSGYRCGHFGKWHVGAVKAESPVNPGAMGFSEWLSHDNFFEMNPFLSRNGGPPEQFLGESSEILIEQTIDFIERVRGDDQPFMAVVWFASPHEPYSGLPEDLAHYDHLPELYSDRIVSLTSNETGRKVQRPLGQVLRERYAEITAMDRAIGHLREYLHRVGLSDNTCLFYCGDNGTSSDAVLASPLRGKKGDIYEGGSLVPGLIEWPAKITSPRSTQFRASTSDLMPTIAAIIDRALPERPVDGISLLPLISGQEINRPAPLPFWIFPYSARAESTMEPYIDPSLQVGTTPLVKLMGGRATRDFINYRFDTITDRDYTGPRALIDGDFKLVIREDSSGTEIVELFDLSTDIAEQDNLAASKPELTQQLTEQLSLWQIEVMESLLGLDYVAGD
jgi:arylsulfatase A-like enzyme